MTRRLISTKALVITVAGIAAAGCGSSSSLSKSKVATTTTPPATTPQAPSTPSTPSTPTAPSANQVLPSGISSSTPITSSVVRQALVNRLSQISAIPASKDESITDCIINKLQAQNLATYGLASSHLNEVKDDSATCTRQALTGHG